MDEAEHPSHLRQVLDWIGWDRILVATDYPHWDFDDPRSALKVQHSPAEKTMVSSGNAKALFRLN